MVDTRSSREALGIIGTVIGLAALGVAIFHFFLGPIEPPRPLGAVVAEIASELKDAVAAKLEGREYAPESEPAPVGPDRIVDTAVIALGFIALAFGVVGFVRREAWRPSGTAIALGSAAIAFQFAIVVVGAILAILLIGYILEHLNLF